MKEKLIVVGRLIVGVIFLFAGFWLITLGELVGYFLTVFSAICTLLFAGELFLVKGPVGQPGIQAILPEDSQTIQAIKIVPQDDELGEQWSRSLQKEYCESVRQFHSVDACKWKGDQSHPWVVSLGAATEIKIDPYWSILSNEMFDTLGKLPGVNDVGQDEHDEWLVDGDVSGEVLIRTAATVVDAFLKNNWDKWHESVSK